MFRWLIILSEVVILIMALQSTFAQYLLSDVQGKVSGWIEHVATIPEQVELRQVHEAMAGPMESMRPYQREYLNDVLKNKGSVHHFHKYYCKGDDKNPFVNGASLHYFCSQIEASELLTI